MLLCKVGTGKRSSAISESHESRDAAKKTIVCAEFCYILLWKRLRYREARPYLCDAPMCHRCRGNVHLLTKQHSTVLKTY
jgi:hypothetical protein